MADVPLQIGPARRQPGDAFVRREETVDPGLPIAPPTAVNWASPRGESPLFFL